MNLLEWYWYRWLSKWLVYSPVPYIPADPVQVFDSMRSDGRDHWGRRLVFVDWLIGTFGEESGRSIWLHIRESNPPDSSKKDEVESSV